MLTDEELTALLRSRESTRVERKESFAADEAKKTACAFANDIGNAGQPGVLFFGVRDDGSCSDIEITDRLLLRVGEIRADGSLQPSPIVEVEERLLDGCGVLVVQVSPHSAPPVRLSGRVYVRVGPRNQLASPEEERILGERRRGRDLPFDHRAATSATFDDIDEFRFRERYLRAAISADVIEQNQRSDRQRMVSLRLVDPSGVPTVGGLLIVGKDPEGFVPGAYVQFNRFEGTELTDPIVDTKRLSGTLDEQLTALDDLLKLNIRTEVDPVSSGLERRKADYPVIALQQLARNAVMHRNYESNAPIRIYWFSNRVEIQNPGGLFGQVTPANFGSVTDYRNPLVAEGMKYYGFVQRFGIGVSLAKKSLLDNANPPPDFEFAESGFTAIVRKSK